MLPIFIVFLRILWTCVLRNAVNYPSPVVLRSLIISPAHRCLSMFRKFSNKLIRYWSLGNNTLASDRRHESVSEVEFVWLFIKNHVRGRMFRNRWCRWMKATDNVTATAKQRGNCMFFRCVNGNNKLFKLIGWYFTSKPILYIFLSIKDQ